MSVMETPEKTPALSDTERAILNRLQDGLPLVPHPYAVVAEEIGIGEDSLLEHLRSMLDSGLLTRFGPMFHAGEMGGGLTLAAIAVPEEDFETVTAQVNRFPEVAHNYRREHDLNMWFVLATEEEEAIPRVIHDIESETGYPVYNMPKEEEFHVNLRFYV